MVLEPSSTACEVTAVRYSMPRHRSLIVVLIATLLCAGSPGTRWFSTRCTHCGTHCPMLSGRLRCHEESHTSGVDCHDRGGARLASCTHSSDAVSGVGWLAVSRPVSDVQSLARSPEFFVTALGLALGEIPEPPTDPPRTRFVA